MTERSRPLPQSLDTLLSDSQKRFEDMFADQMAGGRAVPASVPRTAPAEPAKAPPVPLPDRPEPAARDLAPRATGPIDVVATSRFSGALASIRAEIETGFLRSAAPKRPPKPCAAMIMDGAARLISGTGGAFLAHMLDDLGLPIDPGDVLLVGDPLATGGATANPGAVLAVGPVDHGGDRIGYVAMRGQLDDVGGTAPGSAPADAASAYAEGLRIPPIKICNGGMLNQCALDMILANGRAPDANRTDLMALVSACRQGAAAVTALAERSGIERYHQLGAAMLAHAETAMAAMIRAAVPQEPQSFEDVIDDDGLGNGPFALRLTVWREGDHVYADWTGTAPQAPGPVNVPLHVGRAKAMIGRCIARAMGADAPTNEGHDDLIHVTLPKGSVLNPAFPAPVGRQTQTLSRVRAMLDAAINRHDPARLRAAGGDTAAFSFTGLGFDLAEPTPGGGGAAPGKDGIDAHRAMAHQTPAEEIEADYPVLFETSRSLPDSGGGGQYRGGNGVERIIRFLAPGHVTVHDDRHASRPWGVNGGRPGAASSKWIIRADGGREALPSKAGALPVEPGDRVILRTAGGGGVGEPLGRDPQQVLRDVATGMISLENARTTYGVVIEDGRIDQRATDDLRGGLGRERSRPALFDRGNGA